MRNLIINVAIAATMTGLFVMMLSAQIGGGATAAAQTKTEAAYAVAADPYLPIRMLEAAY